MIYRCYNCGWRINQRKEGEPDNPRIGKYLLCNHHSFCSENCIDCYLGNFKNDREPPPAKCADWSEEGNTGWKINRKSKKTL